MSDEPKQTSGETQSKPAKKKPGSRRPPVKRREILVLVTVWIVGCAIVGGLVSVFYVYRNPGEPTPPPGPAEIVNVPFTGGSAKTAYLSAQEPAQEWRNDVALVAAAANWTDATVESLGQVETWDISFFSTEHSRMYLTIVTADQPALGRAHPFKLRRSPRLINPESWVVDSNEAISIWVNSGGSAFLQAFPENQIEALLRQSASVNRPVWNIIGTSGDQSQIFFLTIDATTGDILNRS